MAKEAISWSEGAIYLYTGAAGVSALVAYAADINITFGRAWDNFPTLDDVYHNVQTGRRADMTLGTLYTVGNSALMAMEAAQTAVHMHLKQSGVWGSAGYYLYSGRIGSMILAGREGDLFRFQLTYHANEWSGY